MFKYNDALIALMEKENISDSALAEIISDPDCMVDRTTIYRWRKHQRKLKRVSFEGIKAILLMNKES